MVTHLKTNKNLPCPYLYPARKGMAFHSWLTSANRDLSQCLSTSLYRILSCTLQVRLHLSLPQEQLRRKLTWKHTYKNQHIRKETADLTRELFRVLFFGEISDWSRITRNMVHQRNRRILTPDWILRFPWCNMIRVILDWSVLRFSQRNVPPLAHPDIYVTSACKCSPRKLSNITGIEKSWEFSWIFLRIF